MASGGRRPGAGRKLKALVQVHKVRAVEILASIDEKAVWRSLARSKDERIRLEAMKYLTDRRDGRAYQSIFTAEMPDRSGRPIWQELDYITAVNRALGYTGQLIPIGAGAPAVIEGSTDGLPASETQDSLDVLPE